MDFEDWIEIWANAEMKHDWGLVHSLVRGQNICKRVGFADGEITHFVLFSPICLSYLVVLLERKDSIIAA